MNEKSLFLDSVLVGNDASNAFVVHLLVKLGSGKMELDFGELGEGEEQSGIVGGLNSSIAGKGDGVGYENGASPDQLGQSHERHFVDFIEIRLLDEGVDFLDYGGGELGTVVEGRLKAGNDVEDVRNETDLVLVVLVVSLHFEEQNQEFVEEVQDHVTVQVGLVQAAHRPAKRIDFLYAHFALFGSLLHFLQEDFLDFHEGKLGEVMEDKTHLVIELRALGHHVVFPRDAIVVDD